jgi:glutaredoxin
MLLLMSNRQIDLPKRQVTLYTRSGCHLCEEAKQEMRAANCANEYTLQEIDIESDAELLRRYQFDIPVIAIDGIEAFRHRLSADEFRDRIAAGASPPSRP